MLWWSLVWEPERKNLLYCCNDMAMAMYWHSPIETHTEEPLVVELQAQLQRSYPHSNSSSRGHRCASIDCQSSTRLPVFAVESLTVASHGWLCPTTSSTYSSMVLRRGQSVFPEFPDPLHHTLHRHASPHFSVAGFWNVMGEFEA